MPPIAASKTSSQRARSITSGRGCWEVVRCIQRCCIVRERAIRASWERTPGLRSSNFFGKYLHASDPGAPRVRPNSAYCSWSCRSTDSRWRRTPTRPSAGAPSLPRTASTLERTPVRRNAPPFARSEGIRARHPARSRVGTHRATAQGRF
jgi:hypothetical protein